jgi:hypothetical protein
MSGLIPLKAIFDELLCARFPPRRRVTVSVLRESPNHCRVLEASDVEHFHVVPRPLWVDYEEIVAGFQQSSRTSNVCKLPWPLVDAPVKLVLDDRNAPIKAVVTGERVYPKRAWVGSVPRVWGTEMAFVVAGILNSAIGYVLYREVAEDKGSRGADLAKGVLSALPIPLPTHYKDAFSNVALLSYRLHMLYQAQRACALDLGQTIRNHWLGLLSGVVQLYGWSEKEAQSLLKEAQAKGLKDIPGFQGDLFFSLQSPLLRVPLLDVRKAERSEELKLKARTQGLTGDEDKELTSLQRLCHWDERVNAPVPRLLVAPSWAGASNEREALKAAYRFLSLKRGQRFGAENPVRVSLQLWEVTVFYSPPRGLKPEESTRLPPGWEIPGKHPAGKLWVDAITGEVREVVEEAQHGVASRS